MRETLKKRIETVVNSFALELYEIEVNEHQRSVRVYVDSPDGVTVGQCTKVASLLKPIISHESYRLEVSSPGVERKLRHPKDYDKAIGKMIRVKTAKGTKVGRLIRVAEQGFDLKTDAETKTFNFDSVKRVNLVVTDEELFRGKSARDN